jgi:hypothetical protein
MAGKNSCGKECHKSVCEEITIDFSYTLNEFMARTGMKPVWMRNLVESPQLLKPGQSYFQLCHKSGREMVGFRGREMTSHSFNKQKSRNSL